MAKFGKKACGRFIAHSRFNVGGCAEIEQTHANGSDEVIATFIQLHRNDLLDLQYLVNRLLETQDN